METLLEVRSVSRRNGGRQAVSGLDFDLAAGEILGLLGPNGAGKTTCLQMLAGHLAPDAGAIRLCGIDLLRAPRRAKAHIGYLPERAPLHPELRVAEYLGYCARLRGLRGADLTGALARVVADCALADFAARRLGALSKGVRQRVGVAQALIGAPLLLLLDEPGDGLDPLQNHGLRDLIRRWARGGRAVIFSSHRLDEVEDLCTRVLILDQGRERYRGALAGSADSPPVLRVRLLPPTTTEGLMALAPIAAAEQQADGSLRVRLHPGATPAQFSRLLVERGFGLTEFGPEPSDLRQRFLRGFGLGPEC